MVDFETAYQATNAHEAMVLSNVPTDRGGMTYGGIARKMAPGASWDGWQIIDRVLARGAGFVPTPGEAKLIAFQHRAFFETEFWRRSNVALLSAQSLANKVYDAYVNCGPAAVEWLQCALNLANRRGKLWPDLRVDGGLGPATAAAAEVACKSGQRQWLVMQLFETQQERRYFELALHDESQEENLLGWYRHRIQFRAPAPV